MKKKLFLLSLLVLGLLSGCAVKQKGLSVKPLKDIKDNQEVKKLDSNLDNSLNLLDELYEDDNIMISPLSLNLALGLVGNGASANTKEVLEGYLSNNLNSFNEFSKNYTANLPKTIEIANGLWVDKKYTLNKETESKMKNFYSTDIQSIEFSKNPTDKINSWVSDKTHKMIPKVVDNVSQLSAIAVNALYFKDSWKEPFEEYQVNEEDFTLFDGTTQKVDMMSSSEGVYYENDKATAFGKRYETEGYTFIGILPNEEGDFSVSDLNLNSLMENIQYTDVDVKFPKFEFNCSLSLKDALKSIGLESVFDSNAINNLVNENIFTIDEILQDTKVIVNEEGTEASAVTSILMVDGCAMSEEEPEIKEVYLDRPFVFMIWDENNKVPLFIGKVVNPKN